MLTPFWPDAFENWCSISTTWINNLISCLSPLHLWPQTISLPLKTSKSSPSSWKQQFEHISWSGALSADLDSIWASVLVWEGGSMVKRITQNSPTRCSLTPCQLFSSIRPSIVPSFAPSSLHLLVCGYLCLFSSFHPCQEDYIVLLSHIFPTHPPSKSL